jgi:hypothetical protein
MTRPQYHSHDWQYRPGFTELRCNRCHLTVTEANRCGMELDCLPVQIVATDEPQPARERGIARQPERKPGNAVTVQQSRSEPLPVPHENGSGTLERIVRASNSDAAIAVELFILCFATFIFWGLAS